MIPGFILAAIYVSARKSAFVLNFTFSVSLILCIAVMVCLIKLLLETSRALHSFFLLILKVIVLYYIP